MKFKNTWPPIVFKDEKHYDIELKDGRVFNDVEYWSMGEEFLFKGSNINVFRDDVVSFIETI